jgi:ribosomal protein S6
MQKYELTVVLEGKATAAKKKKVGEAIEKIVVVVKGKLGKVEDWGVIGTGLYLHFPLELEKSEVKGILAKLNQETEIKKFLLVKKNGKKS